MSQTLSPGKTYIHYHLQVQGHYHILKRLTAIEESDVYPFHTLRQFHPFQACQDILDRTLGKAAQPFDIGEENTVKVVIEGDLKDLAK